MRPPRLATFAIGALLVIGLYYPTSRDAVILKELQFLFSGVLLVLLTCLLLRRGGVLGGWPVPNAAAISAILCLATLATPFTEFGYGAYLPVLLFSVLFCLRLSDLRVTELHRRVFAAANLVNLTCGVLILLQQPSVIEFVGNHYAAAYPELVRYMLDERKPVLMFHSHSVAGFYFYLFFFVTFRAYAATKSRLNLIFALGYLVLTFAINSFTAYFLLGLALFQLGLHLGWRRERAVGAIAALVLTAIAALGLSEYTVDELWLKLDETLASEANGVQGRYSGSGAMMPNLEYIARNPLTPIGLGYSHQLTYGDSGPVNYLMRGSVPLVLAVYSGLFLFFWKNLRSRGDALFLFLVYMGFEVGYGNLEYLRAQYLLPFLVVHLNSLPDPREWRIGWLVRPHAAGIPGVTAK